MMEVLDGILTLQALDSDIRSGKGDRKVKTFSKQSSSRSVRYCKEESESVLRSCATMRLEPMRPVGHQRGGAIDLPCYASSVYSASC